MNQLSPILKVFAGLTALFFLAMPFLVAVQSADADFTPGKSTGGVAVESDPIATPLANAAMDGVEDGSGVTNAGAFRTALGLTTAATCTLGTAANNCVQLNGSGQIPAVSGALLTNLPASGATRKKVTTLSGAIGAVEELDVSITAYPKGWVDYVEITVVCASSASLAIFIYDAQPLSAGCPGCTGVYMGSLVGTSVASPSFFSFTNGVPLVGPYVSYGAIIEYRAPMIFKAASGSTLWYRFKTNGSAITQTTVDAYMTEETL